MVPQLLFVYVKSLRKCFYKQEFSFTNDFDVSFDENKLNISTKKNPYTNLWGETISNINLIVGKNGSGKTTLLDLLGSTKNRRMELLEKNKEDKVGATTFEEWFAVYHIERNIFVIEGHNPYLIENLTNVPSGTSREYSICIKYGFKSKTATYTDYIQFNQQGKFRLDQKMISLYLSNDRSKDWFSGNVIEQESDSFVGFQRAYLNEPQLANIYAFMSKGYKNIEEGFTAKNSICVLKRQKLFGIFNKEDVANSITLKLYKNDNKILLFKNNFLSKFLNSGVEKKVEKWTTKEKFIIKLLESIIFDLWINVGRDELNNNTKCIKDINSILFEEDNLENRVKYLLQVLKEIFKALDPNRLIEQVVYDRDFIEECINILTDLNENYFEDGSNLFVTLNNGYDEEVYKLLSLYDRYVGNEYQLSHFMDIKFKNMSAGELELVNGFANLYTVIHIAIHNNQIDTVLLLLDEPDAFFHPEWSRRYIYNIYQFLNTAIFGRKVKFQILITTHSPFIVSDVPKDHITCINVTQDTPGILERKVKKADFGLMSNFYDIIKNDFFIASPIGEYAKFIFEGIVKKINNLKEWDKCEVDNLKAIISSVGDEVIRTKLQQLFNEKELELLPEEERITRKIKELELELKDLKNMQGRGSND